MPARYVVILSFAALQAIHSQVYADTSSECRGVAAGVVAALRASGEIEGEASVASAILAAQRSCEAVLMNLGSADTGGSDKVSLQKTDAETEGTGSFWGLFGSSPGADADVDDGPNPGIDRLKRLRN